MSKENKSELAYLTWKSEEVGLTQVEQREFHKLLLLENEGCENE